MKPVVLDKNQLDQLMLAIIKDNPKELENFFSSNNVPVDAYLNSSAFIGEGKTDLSENNALRMAVSAGKLQSVEWLISRGAKLDESLLSVAVKRNQIELIEKLQEKKKWPLFSEATRTDMLTEWASSQENSPEVVQRTIDALSWKVGVEAAAGVIKSRNEEMVDAVLGYRKGRVPVQESVLGHALLVAIQEDYSQVLPLLAKAGANLGIKAMSTDYITSEPVIEQIRRMPYSNTVRLALDGFKNVQQSWVELISTGSLERLDQTLEDGLNPNLHPTSMALDKAPSLIEAAISSKQWGALHLLSEYGGNLGNHLEKIFEASAPMSIKEEAVNQRLDEIKTSIIMGALPSSAYATKGRLNTFASIIMGSKDLNEVFQTTNLLKVNSTSYADEAGWIAKKGWWKEFSESCPDLVELWKKDEKAMNVVAYVAVCNNDKELFNEVQNLADKNKRVPYNWQSPDFDYQATITELLQKTNRHHLTEEKIEVKSVFQSRKEALNASTEEAPKVKVGFKHN